MLIVATTPLWDESPATIAPARASVEFPGSAIRWLSYAGGLRSLVFGGRFKSESEMRDYGRVMASNAGARWWLQLDADETLVHGERLPALLSRWPELAFPLLYVNEAGGLELAPAKLLRLEPRFTVVYRGDHVLWASDRGRVWDLSPTPALESERRALLSGAYPYVVHEPERRPAERRLTRLSQHAGAFETRPASVRWPLVTSHYVGGVSV